MFFLKNNPSIFKEKKKKELSMLKLPDGLIKSFLKESSLFFSKKDTEKINDLLKFILKTKASNPYHPSMYGYISHPVRVASFYLKLAKKPCLDYVFVSLLHNFFEITSFKEKELIEKGFSKKICKAITTLTVDRKLEKKKSYLNKYYSKIESFSKNLALIKCVDKLDNLLAVKIICSNSERLNYIRDAEEFVYPITKKISKDLSESFKKIIHFSYNEKHDETFKKNVEKFNKKLIN